MQLGTVDIKWVVITGTALMIVMLFSIIIFIITHQRRVIQLNTEIEKEKEKRQIQLLQAALESQEAERKRISDELHDEVGALLSAIKLYLHQLNPQHLTSNAKAEVLNQSKNLLDETIKTVRNLSSNLQPIIIADFGLESTIQHFCNKINQPPVFSTSLTIQDALIRLSPEKELAIFRIVQELTNNIIKHAQSSYIHFSLVQKTDTLEIYIEYNGMGISHEEYEEKLYQVQGLGLKNIQNRLNILKGNVHYEKNDNLTNMITVRIPVTDQKP